MNLFAIESAMAQANGPASAQNPIMSFLPFILIFMVFYFLMIRPQKKKIEEEKTFLSALQKGDEVFTKAGMIGTIQGLTDKVVTLEIAQGINVKILRSQVAGLAKKIFEVTPTAQKK